MPSVCQVASGSAVNAGAPSAAVAREVPSGAVTQQMSAVTATLAAGFLRLFLRYTGVPGWQWCQGSDAGVVTLRVRTRLRSCGAVPQRSDQIAQPQKRP